jgi:hypothetical protein
MALSQKFDRHHGRASVWSSYLSRTDAFFTCRGWAVRRRQGSIPHVNLKTAVGERRIRQAAEREDVARKAAATKSVNCEAVGFRTALSQSRLCNILILLSRDRKGAVMSTSCLTGKNSLNCRF